MFFTLIFTAVVLAVTLILLTWKKPKNYPPGPAWVPFVGTIPQVKKVSKEAGGYHLGLQKLSERYKSNVIGLKSGKENIIVVYSYNTLKEVYTNEDFQGRPINFFVELRNMGMRLGVTIPDGRLWKIQRKFVVTHLRSLGFGKQGMEELIRNEVEDLLLAISELEGKETTMENILALPVLNVLWTLTSGQRLLRSDKRLRTLLNLLQERSRTMDIAGGTLNHFPWLRFVAPERSGYNLIQRLNSHLKAMMLETINYHFANWHEGREDDLIYAFITEMKRDTDPDTTFTEDQLLMVALDMFMAGAQITSHMIDYTFYAMIKYPEIQEKIRSCINEAFGQNEAISYGQRDRIPYVEAVISEILRFYHVMPISGPRRALRDTMLENYFIPKDTTVLLSLYSLNFDKTYWKDPENFRPERFLDAEGKFINHEILIPFGLGKRKCLGDVLARSAIFTYSSEVLRSYKVVLHPRSPPLTGIPRPGITLTPERYTAMFIKQ